MVNEKTYLSASAVMQAGWDLRDALADPARLELATDRLASAAEQSIAQLDDVATMAFQSAGRQVAVERVDSTEDLLAAALSQLEVANTLLAASRAVGEHGDAEPAELDRSLRRLDGAITTLRAQDQPAVQGFQAEAPARSSTVDEAVAALGKQLGATVDAVVTRSTGVIGKAITGIHQGGPDFVAKAWNWVNERVNLEEIGGKLVRLGMRALHAALGLLVKVFPAERLRAMRADVQGLIDEMSDGPAGQALGRCRARCATGERECRAGCGKQGPGPGAARPGHRRADHAGRPARQATGAVERAEHRDRLRADGCHGREVGHPVTRCDHPGGAPGRGRRRGSHRARAGRRRRHDHRRCDGMTMAAPTRVTLLAAQIDQEVAALARLSTLLSEVAPATGTGRAVHGRFALLIGGIERRLGEVRATAANDSDAALADVAQARGEAAELKREALSYVHGALLLRRSTLDGGTGEVGERLLEELTERTGIDRSVLLSVADSEFIKHTVSMITMLEPCALRARRR